METVHTPLVSNYLEFAKASDRHNTVKGANNPTQKFLTVLKDEFKMFIYLLSDQKSSSLL